MAAFIARLRPAKQSSQRPWSMKIYTQFVFNSLTGETGPSTAGKFWLSLVFERSVGIIKILHCNFLRLPYVNCWPKQSKLPKYFRSKIQKRDAAASSELSQPPGSISPKEVQCSAVLLGRKYTVRWKMVPFVFLQKPYQSFLNILLFLQRKILLTVSGNKMSHPVFAVILIPCYFNVQA